MIEYVKRKLWKVDRVTLDRWIDRLPVSRVRKLSLHRSVIDRHYISQFVYGKSVGMDHNDLNDINSAWGNEVAAIDDAEARLVTNSLCLTATKLRVQIPQQFSSDLTGLTSYWTTTSETSQRVLSDEGVRKLTEDIRAELRWRRESRKHWMGYIAAITGLVGAVTGLVSAWPHKTEAEQKSDTQQHAIAAPIKFDASTFKLPQ
jgi:hypothetical protein